MMRSREILTISGIVLLDALGFGMILPLLPYYAESYGASTSTIGMLVASYAIGQFIGAPLLGRASDRWGRKPVLVASVMGSCFGFLIWGFASQLGAFLSGLGLGQAQSLSLFWLFSGRTLDGLSGGNLPLAQAYVADLTDIDQRGRGLATISAALGLGFVVGPLVGGFLSLDGDYEFPSRLAAGLAILNAAAVVIFLPDVRTRNEVAHSNSVLGILQIRIPKPVRPLLLTSLLHFFALNNFTGIFTLYTLKQFEFTTHDNGKLLAVLALLAAAFQVLFVGRLIQRKGEVKLLTWGLPTMGLLMLAWGATRTSAAFVAVTIGVALTAAVLNVSLRSLLTKLVPDPELGEFLGYQASLESACKVFGPLCGAALMEFASTGAPGLFSAAVLLAFSIPLLRWLRLSTRGILSART